MQSTQNACRIESCDNPVKRQDLCYSHYMRGWRYGDPEFVPDRTRVNLTGQKFGSLTVVRRISGARWFCTCDCGRTHEALTGDLKRGTTQSCGDRTTHRRKDVVGSSGAHMRVRNTRGPAKELNCVDCGEKAAHWSYDHNDPQEISDPRGPYSLDPEHYEPRCVPCHKRFDLDALAA